jgi:hypothetical protein
MAKFPVDAPKSKVIKVFEGFGFSIVREKEHIYRVCKVVCVNGEVTSETSLHTQWQNDSRHSSNLVSASSIS